MAAVVTCRNIAKRFANGTLALSDVTLDVVEHQFLSLLGPSGCGKSTLLRLIAGLSEPSAGTIEWQGGAAGLSFVFQEPTLMPWATALDNVLLPLRLEHVPNAQRRQRAAAALAQVGLGGFEKSYPRELSGGMRMRVSIARALVTRPKVLLMDEPFAALDEITRRALADDLLALCEELSPAALFVTHNVEEAVYMAGRVIVMGPRPGRLAGEVRVKGPVRRAAGFRTTQAFIEAAEQVSACLAQAMAA